MPRSPLTPARRARLEKLATYLEGLPADYQRFDMALFVDSESAEDEARYALKNGGLEHCGTAACAAGHGPAAGILAPRSIISFDKQGNPAGVDWSQYCRLFVGDDWSANDFLFAGGWSAIDDSHYGAAARIRYLLDKGKPPDFFLSRPAQMRLYAPYRIDAKAPAS